MVRGPATLLALFTSYALFVSPVVGRSRKLKTAIPDVIKPTCEIGAPTQQDQAARLQYGDRAVIKMSAYTQHPDKRQE